METTRQRVFCASLADVFEDRDDLMNWRNELLDLITATPNLDWLLLTKRPENVMSFSHFVLPENVWIGTTVENQEVAEKRIKALVDIPAKVRFLSCEPLIGQVNIDWRYFVSSIQWVIAGGESGPKARPVHPDWVRSLRDQCENAAIPFHFKQWGEWLPAGQESSITGQSVPENAKYHDFGNMISVRVGKRAAGHLLDGKEWLEFPKTG
jgi:protein gp37